MDFSHIEWIPRCLLHPFAGVSDILVWFALSVCQLSSLLASAFPEKACVSCFFFFCVFLECCCRKLSVFLRSSVDRRKFLFLAGRPFGF